MVSLSSALGSGLPTTEAHYPQKARFLQDVNISYNSNVGEVDEYNKSRDEKRPLPLSILLPLTRVPPSNCHFYVCQMQLTLGAQPIVLCSLSLLLSLPLSYCPDLFPPVSLPLSSCFLTSLLLFPYLCPPVSLPLSSSLLLFPYRSPKLSPSVSRYEAIFKCVVLAGLQVSLASYR